MEQNTKKVFSRIGLALAATVIVVTVLERALGTLIEKFAPSIASSGWFTFILLLVFYLIGLPLFFLITKGLPDGEIKESKKLSIKEIIFFFLSCYGVSIVINLITAGLLYFLKGGHALNPIQSLFTTSSVIGSFLFVGILSPIVEEIMFRGFLLNKLRCYGDKIAIITTAVLFGLFHDNFFQFFFAISLGLFFAYVTLKTGTIKYSIILHILVNLTGCISSTLIGGGTTILLGIWGLLLLVLIIVGIVLFILNIKKISLNPADIEIQEGQVFKTTCLNVGMIINFIINLAIMIYLICL